jgi:hypothetical protein
MIALAEVRAIVLTGQGPNSQAKPAAVDQRNTSTAKPRAYPGDPALGARSCDVNRNARDKRGHDG